jgi:hypothetical protein
LRVLAGKQRQSGQRSGREEGSVLHRIKINLRR